MENSKKEIAKKINLLMKDYDFSGSILLAQEDEIVFKESFGMANYELGVANSSTTKYRIGSITKLFTATAIMQLVENQQLDLDSTVDRYIADYPNGNQIKIFHLLSHTSGIANLTELPDFLEWVKNYSPILKTIDRFKYKPFDFPPGQGYKYSNSGYILLSYILELITGHVYEQYLVENIFNPLNMKNSGFDKQEKIIKQRASGYNIKGTELINAPPIHMSNPYGAASLYSTTEDLYLFSQAFNTNQLLSQDSIEKMQQPGLGEHGLGWMIKRDKNQRVVHHGGGIHGFSANFLRYTDTDITVAVLSNVFYPKHKIEEISNSLVEVAFSRS
ncbi:MULTISPECIES: serine hydrolase domain-containing protein [Caryophanaceae]|uniref:serine hydrolase domain-containing protein n=1 Tax=Caryophanaceae TaxID=186818 RepID=UPI00249088C1|nr:serine hydrolase domain-containing protein [Planomicrobium okeanokoites]